LGEGGVGKSTTIAQFILNKFIGKFHILNFRN